MFEVTVPLAAIEWIVGSDTGASSKTIWAVMMGVPSACSYLPADQYDFGRCCRLLQLLPEWWERLPEVGDVYPEWKPTIAAWDELTAWQQRLEVAGDFFDPAFSTRLDVLATQGEANEARSV